MGIQEKSMISNSTMVSDSFLIEVVSSVNRDVPSNMLVGEVPEELAWEC